MDDCNPNAEGWVNPRRPLTVQHPWRGELTRNVGPSPPVSISLDPLCTTGDCNPNAEGWVNPRRPLTVQHPWRGELTGNVGPSSPASVSLDPLCTTDNCNPNAEGWVNPRRPLTVQRPSSPIASISLDPLCTVIENNRNDDSWVQPRCPLTVMPPPLESELFGGWIDKCKMDLGIYNDSVNEEEEHGSESIYDSYFSELPPHPWPMEGESWDRAVAEAERHCAALFGSDYTRYYPGNPPSNEP
ncbi:uncharacterized protein LOC121774055 [Salvia splendens]|uniref:uncharacterized protein LOC121774055 n=1 Tax=Salvia splendens TaxID=180675 RepID=UPI001C2616D1|nr:uncharacterized protein LOC121774055 [Salvia splendens]XP_042026907.1 uncharacterized protein LOC121774055 [Salvia splendens]